MDNLIQYGLAGAAFALCFTILSLLRPLIARLITGNGTNGARNGHVGQKSGELHPDFWKSAFHESSLSAADQKIKELVLPQLVSIREDTKTIRSYIHDLNNEIAELKGTIELALTRGRK